MQGEHWIIIANFGQKMYFADSSVREKHIFLKHFREMMPKPLQSNISVWDFYTLYAPFHLFKFHQEELSGVHHVNVFSFKSKYM